MDLAKRALVESLYRDLSKRSCQETFYRLYRDLPKRSLAEILPGDAFTELVQRSCQGTFYRYLVQRPGEESRGSEFFFNRWFEQRSYFDVSYRDLL